MRHRHPLPKIWLMTDPRGGDPVAILRRARAPMGVIVRHYDRTLRARRALVKRLIRAAAGRHLVIAAAPPLVARQWGAAGAHDRSTRCSRGLRTVAVHNAREAAMARRIKADLIFVSPVFVTRSHPGAEPLGIRRASQIAGVMRTRTIALGGMTEQRFRRVRSAGFYGWSGIDAFGG